jgi:Zn-dependent metalloprotease
VKKFLSIFAALLVAFVAFAFLTKTAEADKTVFGTKSFDDVERVKQISLDYLRNDTANRSIGNTSELKAQSVEFDKLNMAHTKVRQTVNEVPVWEGEAIVHLKSDGSLSTITDNLKESLFVNTQPNFSADEAIEIAEKMYGDSAALTAKSIAEHEFIRRDVLYGRFNPQTGNFQYEQHRQYFDRNRRNAIALHRHGRQLEYDRAASRR